METFKNYHEEFNNKEQKNNLNNNTEKKEKKNITLKDWKETIQKFNNIKNDLAKLQSIGLENGIYKINTENNKISIKGDVSEVTYTIKKSYEISINNNQVDIIINGQEANNPIDKEVVYNFLKNLLIVSKKQIKGYKEEKDKKDADNLIKSL